jgi:CYTH domain-containing protein
MSIEIERKFLVKGDQWRKGGNGELYRQGYLSTEIERTVRIRTIGKSGLLTIKGKTQNIQRDEFEYEIPFADAKFMLDLLCKQPLIEKTRYKISQNDLVWEIDEFWGENEGLILAEVELDDANSTIIIPDWIGIEVTENPAYYNANLVKNPFSKWDHTIR